MLGAPQQKSLLEKYLQQAASRLLELDGWRYLKMEPISRREWGKGTGEKGMADSLFLRYLFEQRHHWLMRAQAEVLWCEWKRPGEKPKPHQIAWQLAEKARGALVVCAGVDFPATFDGFLDWYRNKSGLLRRKGL